MKKIGKVDLLADTYVSETKVEQPQFWFRTFLSAF